MLHFVNPYWMNTFFGEWYLGDLFVFYILSLLLFRRIQNLKQATVAFAVSLGTGFFLECLIRVSLVWAGVDDPILNVYFYNFSPLHQLPIWFLGVLMYYLLKLLRERGWERYSWCFLLVGFYGLTYCTYVSQSLVPADAVIGVAFLLFALGTALKKFPLISNPFLGFLGKHSYGIYLFHIMLLGILGKRGLPWAVRVPMAVVIALVLDIVINGIMLKITRSIYRTKNK